MLKEKDLRTVYILLIVLFAGLLVYMLRDFLDAFLGAVIFYVLFRPLVKYLCEKRKWKRGMAALVVLVLSFLIVLVPVFMLTYMLVSKLTLFFGDTSMIMKTLASVESAIREATGFMLFSEENIRAVQGRAAQYVTALLSESFSMAGDVALMYFFLYYLLANYGRLGQAIFSFLPFQGKNMQIFIDGLRSMTFSNALGAPVLALLRELSPQSGTGFSASTNRCSGD
jgi:predicted PurR-regulated permease PerM